MNDMTEAVVTILTAIVGVAILAVLVSKNSNTTGVIQAGGSAFVNSLATAISPVTGSQVQINSTYPSNSNTPSFQ